MVATRVVATLSMLRVIPIRHFSSQIHALIVVVVASAAVAALVVEDR